MKVAIVLESPHASPRARALSLGRRLAAGGELVAVTCLVDAVADGPALAARLGVKNAFFVADAALAKTGSRGRAQVLARLLERARIDLALVDAAADGGGGLFSASLAYFADLPGFFRAYELERDPARPDAALVSLDLAGTRQRLRIDLPAVVSVVGEATASPALAIDVVRSRSFTLADLGLDAGELAGEPIPGPSFVPVYRRPVVVSAIDDLLR